MLEHDIQNSIRLAISENNLGVSFRTNVGQAWTGEQIIKNINSVVKDFKQNWLLPLDQSWAKTLLN